MTSRYRRLTISLALTALPLMGLAQKGVRPQEGRDPTVQAQRSLEDVRTDLREAQDVLRRMPEGRGRERLQTLLSRAQDNTARAMREIQGIGRRETIAPEDFARVRKQLRDEGFDDNRVRFLREVSRRNGFTSRQVRELLETFKFDEGRGEAAVLLYPHVVDPGNFFQALEVFRFEAEREKVRERIRLIQRE